MSMSIDQAFVKQFEREVHEAYQRQGSKLRPTVRVKNGVIGSSTVFQKVGKGDATTKARNAVMPTMNVDHSTVEAQLVDYYAGDWIDRSYAQVWWMGQAAACSSAACMGLPSRKRTPSTS